MDSIVAPSDTVVALLTIVLTALLTRYGPEALVARLKPWIPLFVLTLAVGLCAAGDVVLGGAVTWESAGHGLIAAGVAVLGHAQIRSSLKARAAAAQGDNPEPAGPVPLDNML